MSSTPAFSAEQLLKHSGWARSLARQLVADAATAEDVVQETWIAALREQPSTDRPLRPWLERVLRNFASNARRNRATRGRHEQAAASGEATSASVADVVAKAEGQQRVVAAVLSLAEPYRSVVLLRYYEGLSAAEIARRSETPAGTVRWQVKQGLALLRDKLDEDEGGDRCAWCVALLPLTGFRSAHELVSTSTAAKSLPTGVRSSFLSMIKGALVMKSVWMAGVAAVGLVALLWLLQLGGGMVMLAPQPEQPEVASEVVELPEQVYVRSEAPVPAADVEDREPGDPVWRAHVKMRFVDHDGVGVGGVRVRFSRHEERVSDRDGRLQLPVPKPFGNARKHVSSLVLAARHPDFANVHRSVAAALLVGTGDAIELGIIRLEAGASITGTVVDESGAPLAGARVGVDGRGNASARTDNLFLATPMSRDRVGQASTTSDANGAFRIDGVLPGSNVVSGTLLDGDIVDERTGERRVAVDAGATAHVQLTLRPRLQPEDIVTIVVLDPDGKPVPRVYLNVQSSRGNSTNYTDESGRARTGFAGAGRTVDITATAPDNRFATVVHEGARLGETVTIRFEKPVTLALRVVSDAGRAIRTVKVRLHTVASSGFFGIGRKNPVDLVSGEFDVAADGAVAGLVVPNERFEVEVEASGHELRTVGPFDRTMVRGGVEVRLAACPTVAGVVVDAAGKAVPGAVVALHRRPSGRMIYNGFPVWLNPRAEERVETDAQGRFTLDARGDETFFVRAHADGFAATITEELFAQQFVDRKEPLRLELNQGGAIRGYVLRADGRSAGGSIVAVTRGDGFARTTRVAADGSYRFDRLTPGAYKVQRTGRDLSGDESSWQTGLGRAVRALPDPNCQVVVGKVAQCDLGARFVHDAKLAGRVAVEGWPMRGQRVAIEFAEVKEGQQSPEGWHATIGDGGHFDVPLLPSGALLLRLTDGKHLIESRLDLLPGENRFDLVVATKEVTLRDLPTETTQGQPQTVMARWSDGPTTIRIPLDIDADGSAVVSVPKGKVALERAPTEADLAEILRAGGFTMIPFREIVVE